MMLIIGITGVFLSGRASVQAVSTGTLSPGWLAVAGVELSTGIYFIVNSAGA
jgi:hypothetical protein